MVVFKGLFGQKEEIDKKDYFDYDKIPQETRQKVFFGSKIRFKDIRKIFNPNQPSTQKFCYKDDN
ncbi:MAG: hypothetical protein AABY14_04980 [Nanoarchaeota archaeon]